MEPIVLQTYQLPDEHLAMTEDCVSSGTGIFF